MRLSALIFTAGLVTLTFCAPAANGETIAYWAQNDNNLPGGGFGFQPGDFPQAADVGIGSLSLANFNSATLVNNNGETVYQCIQSFGGTTINSEPGFPSGGSLSPQGCSDNSNNGMQIVLTVSTQGYKSISLSWAQQRTSTGFNSSLVEWSADAGGSFNTAGDTGAVPNSFALQSFDLSAVAALDDNQNVVFRITLNGATATAGNNRFDNIRVAGTALNGGPIDPPEPDFCAADSGTDESLTRIHDIQGDGFASPILGSTVEVQAIVVGAFQDTGANQIGGFFLQELDANVDDDPQTSEGVFISGFQASATIPDVVIGQEVRIAGEVRERFGQTEVFGISNFEVCAQDRLAEVSPAVVQFPIDDLIELEAIEGMWVRLPQAMAVTEVFNAARFAEFSVAVDRLFQPTQVVAPGLDANALEGLNDRSRLIIDQGLTGSYRTPYQAGLDGTPINASNPIRAGYRIQPDFEGVMGYGFDAYRLFALQPAEFDDTENPRPAAAPALPEGNLRVASFNVENLFSTIQTGGVGCGPNFLNCRGATSDSELARQLIKVAEALLGLNADLVGLVEIENDNDDSTLGLLVDMLNHLDPIDDWAFVTTGHKGTDAIKNAIIYRTAKLAPIGLPAILDGSVTVTPSFDDSRQRPVLTQAFEHLDSGQIIALSVFHLRSKNCGSNASGANLDQNDGQGCWNALRTESVESFLSWLDTDPTGTGTDLHLVSGDINAYAQEDPLQALVNAGFVNQAIASNNDDPGVYSYIFQGQSGSLDHVLASPALNEWVLGAANWAINADEIPAFAYPETLPNSALPKPEDFFNEDPFRSSDHDPLIVSLQLPPAPVMAIVAINDVVQTYTGAGIAVSVSTEPENLSVLVTYDGASDLPVNVGIYSVEATVTEEGFVGSAEAVLVIEPATAGLVFSDLQQLFTGEPLQPTVTTNPPGLNTVLSFDGQALAPTSIGNYIVTATIDEANYVGTASAIFRIVDAAPQALRLAQQPSGFNLIGQPLTPALVVEVLNGVGEIADNDNTTVIELRLLLESPVPASVTPAYASATVVEGVAVFDALLIGQPGARYRFLIQDSAGNLSPLITEPFDVEGDSVFADRFE